MPLGDIRPLKAQLREQYKSYRRSMPPEIKKACDQQIADRVTALWQYRHNSLLLTYVSFRYAAKRRRDTMEEQTGDD